MLILAAFGIVYVAAFICQLLRSVSVSVFSALSLRQVVAVVP